MHDALFWMQCLYFFLPAYVANTIPVIAARFQILPRLAVPIDGGRNWFGPHKTIRGFLLGTTGGVLCAYCQAKLHSFESFALFSLTDYNRVNPLILGFLLGFGSLTGDSLGSFVKRRLHMRPGEHLWFLDELTMAAGAIVCMAILYPTPSARKAYIVIACILITFAWHITAAKTAYLFRIREVRW